MKHSPPDWPGNGEFPDYQQVHPSGKYLYCSNRGDNSIVSFRIEPDGKLFLLDHVKTNGRIPRDFNIDPTGRFLLAANQNSDNIAVFRIDQGTGLLSDTNYAFPAETPVCIVFGAQR